jgi:ATP-dependent Clp protease adaptor protein ClpS
VARLVTVTQTVERTSRGSGSGLGTPWKVIVLNDNHNTFEGVAAALSRVIPGVNYERGLQIADLIHNQGRAIVWSGHREAAELYWTGLRDSGLTMAPLEQ